MLKAQVRHGALEQCFLNPNRGWPHRTQLLGVLFYCVDGAAFEFCLAAHFCPFWAFGEAQTARNPAWSMLTQVSYDVNVQ